MDQFRFNHGRQKAPISSHAADFGLRGVLSSLLKVEVRTQKYRCLNLCVRERKGTHFSPRSSPPQICKRRRGTIITGDQAYASNRISPDCSLSTQVNLVGSLCPRDRKQGAHNRQQRRGPKPPAWGRAQTCNYSSPGFTFLLYLLSGSNLHRKKQSSSSSRIRTASSIRRCVSLARSLHLYTSPQPQDRKRYAYVRKISYNSIPIPVLSKNIIILYCAVR